MDKKNSFYLLKHLLVGLIVVSVVEIIKYNLNFIEPESNRLKDEFMSNIIFSLVAVLFLSPVIEELVFRLPLKKDAYFVISIVTSFIFFLSSNFLFIKIIIGIFIAFIIVYQFYRDSIILKRVLISMSIIAFTIVHFDNFNSNLLNNIGLFNLIILFSPQFFLAILLTKIRLETRFINAVIFHSLYNLTILSLSLLFDF